MAGRKTGVTSETMKHLVLDAGVIYLNWGSTDPQKPQTKLGACRGGNTFTVETEWRDMPFDGVGGVVKGARRPISVTVSLTANLVELSKDLIKIAVPGADYDPAGTAAVDLNGQPVVGEKQYVIKRVMDKAIPDFDYGNIAIVAKYSGTTTDVVCVLKSAMANSNLELNFADADEAVIAITFTGMFDPDDIDTEPWEIIMPERVPI
jgi:hypothetical protein